MIYVSYVLCDILWGPHQLTVWGIIWVFDEVGTMYVSITMLRSMLSMMKLIRMLKLQNHKPASVQV